MFRHIWLAIGLWVCTACGEEVPVGSGVDPADALAVQDAQVTGQWPDAQDVPPDVPVVPDAGPVGLPAWLTGTWLECGGDLTIQKPDQLVWHASGSACTVTGHVAWAEGALVFADLVPANCSGPPPTWLGPGAHATFDGKQLTIVNPAIFSGIKRLTAKASREYWTVTASTGGKGILRLCFDQDGLFYDGNWNSADCSLIACGSVVSQVKHVDTATHIWTQCQGGCPCSSILMASEKTDAQMAGKYSSGNCQHAEDGTFTALRGTFP